MSETIVGKIELGPSNTNYVYNSATCLSCNGTGKTAFSCQCQTCNGKGHIEDLLPIPILKIKVEAGGFLPKRAHDGDAGIDFFSPFDFTVQPRTDFLLALNIRTAFPSGWVLWMAEKSGVSTKKKLDIGACIVDSGYRGIVHCHMFNNSDYEQSFKRGEKVVQGILVKCVTTGQPVQVEELDETPRGEGAFGSTNEKK